MTIAFDVLTITLAGLMVGVELAIAAFVHPVLWRMEERVHAQTAAALARTMAAVMPAWYSLTLLLTLAVVWEHRALSTSRGPLLLLVAATLGWCFAIALTLSRFLPLSAGLVRMDPDLPHREWLVERSRWDGLHRWRIVLLLASLAMLSVGVLGVWRDFIPTYQAGLL
jgi:hypothetical protein